MARNDSLIETTERFYRLFQQSKKQQIKTEKQLQQAIAGQATPTLPNFVGEQTKITRLDDSEFIKIREGIELLLLWGNGRRGPSGKMVRFAQNTPQKIQVKAYFAMVISGEVKHWKEAQPEKDAELLRAGDSLTQKAGSSLCIESYPTKETTLLYIHCDGPVEIRQSATIN